MKYIRKAKILPILALSMIFGACSTKSNLSSSSNSSLTTPTTTTTTTTVDSDNSMFKYGDFVRYKDSNKNDDLIYEEIEALKNKVVTEYDSVFTSSYEQGLLDFFNIENEIKLTIFISNDELQKLNMDHLLNNRESYRICDLEIELNGILYHYEDVGIRQKGNTSRGVILNDDNTINLKHYKFSLSETFDDEFRGNKVIWDNEDALLYREERSFFGLEKFFIRSNNNKDATYIKEYYAFEMYRANGLLAPHSNPMNVSMNIDGDIQNMGVYLGVEDIDKDFIKRNLGKPSRGGDLYKLGWGSSEPAKFDKVDDSYFGTEAQAAYGNGSFYQYNYSYDLKINKKTSTHQSIKDLITNILEYDNDNFDTFMKDYMIYDKVIDYMAISYLLGDPDDLRGNFNNTYIYFTSDTNKAFFIPTDNDRVLGSTGGSNPTGHFGTLTKPFSNSTGYYGVNDRPLWTKSILEDGNEKIKADYLKKVNEIAASKWMDIENFKSYFNHARSNYSDDLSLGNRISADMPSFSLVENNNLSDNWNLSIDVYLSTKKNTVINYTPILNPSEFYLRGVVNNWDGITEEYNLQIIDDTPTIRIYLSNTQSFKISNSDWSVSFDYDDLVDNSLFESESEHKNILAKESGYYLIKIIGYNTDNILLSIEKE